MLGLLPGAQCRRKGGAACVAARAAAATEASVLRCAPRVVRVGIRVDGGGLVDELVAVAAVVVRVAAAGAARRPARSAAFAPGHGCAKPEAWAAPEPDEEGIVIAVHEASEALCGTARGRGSAGSCRSGAPSRTRRPCASGRPRLASLPLFL